METRICKNCKREKNIVEFRKRKDNGNYRHTCLQCEYDFHKKYIKENTEKEKIYKKRYYEKHKEKVIKNVKKYYNENKDNLKIKAKERYIKNYDKISEQKKLYTKINRKRITAQEMRRKETDPLFRLKKLVRQSIRDSFKRKGLIKSSKTATLLGCSLKDFYQYILLTYKNNYNENYNKNTKIHIDHIVPLSTAKTEEEVKRLCHYTNLQLLKAEDNLKKSNKLDWKKENNI